MPDTPWTMDYKYTMFFTVYRQQVISNSSADSKDLAHQGGNWSVAPVLSTS